MRQVEDLILSVATGEGSVEVPVRDERVRDITMNLIDSMPAESENLSEWHQQVIRLIDGAAAAALTDGVPMVEAANAIPLPRNLASVSLDEFRSTQRSDGLLVTTVHGVKGQSLDGVLLVADHQTTHWGREAETWSEFFRASRQGHLGGIESEELRIIYVGLTRAERLCCIAVPDDTTPSALRSFEEAGFALSA
jgi:superfamily I DNA/RNA helicase